MMWCDVVRCGARMTSCSVLSVMWCDVVRWNRGQRRTEADEGGASNAVICFKIKILSTHVGFKLFDKKMHWLWITQLDAASRHNFDFRKT